MLIRALGLSLVQMVKMYSYTIHQLKLTVLRVLEGQKVSYDVEQEDRGPKATNVVPQ